jgi:putative PIN family toxin of toxin-antitoxin system
VEAGLMTRAVFDSSILVSGFGWHGESYLCLVAMARRRVAVCSSAWILEEVSRRLKELEAERRLASDPWPAFKWFSNTAEIVEPGPTGKQRSRDPKDDPILGTALAAGVSRIVSRDRDLLDLQRPFEIEIVRPGQFLRELNR